MLKPTKADSFMHHQTSMNFNQNRGEDKELSIYSRSNKINLRGDHSTMGSFSFNLLNASPPLCAVAFESNPEEPD